MKEKRTQKLIKELKYLLDSEVKKEITENDSKLNDNNISVEDIANDIYLKRGLDTKKLKNKFNLIELIGEMSEVFKNKDNSTKRKMIIEILYIILLIILIKIPFDLVRDIGYEYLEILSNNSLLYTLWTLAFLVVYTITIICVFIVFARNFNNKYRNIK